jgi:hypothetical protein
MLLSRKLYSVANLYSDDVINDVITIRGNQNFYLPLFVKGRSLQKRGRRDWNFSPQNLSYFLSYSDRTKGRKTKDEMRDFEEIEICYIGGERLEAQV